VTVAGSGTATRIDAAPSYGAALGVAGLSLISAAIHLWVLPAHLQAWWAYGVFFAIAAAAQVLTAAIALWRPLTWPLVAGVVANAGIIVVWVISRTSGLPLGPPVLDMTAGLADPTRGGYGEHAVGNPESVGLLDTAATVSELLTVCALLALLSEVSRRRTINVLLVGGFLLLSAFLVPGGITW
jgi:hypothetical protein